MLTSEPVMATTPVAVILAAPAMFAVNVGAVIETSPDSIISTEEAPTDILRLAGEVIAIPVSEN
jgi:hypothetical protein